MATNVGSADFQRAVIERSREVPVVVDFWAAWCAPCRTLGPVIERVAESYRGRADLVKVDTDANQDLAMSFGIRGIPAVKAFRNGEVVHEFTGALPETSVVAFFEDLMALEAKVEGRAATLAAAQQALGTGDLAEARRLLATLPADAEVSRLLADVDLREAGVELEDPEVVLESLLRQVRAGDREEARERMVAIFEVLGPDHPLTQRFRGELTSALF